MTENSSLKPVLYIHNMIKSLQNLAQMLSYLTYTDQDSNSHISMFIVSTQNSFHSQQWFIIVFVKHLQYNFLARFLHIHICYCYLQKDKFSNSPYKLALLSISCGFYNVLVDSESCSGVDVHPINIF